MQSCKRWMNIVCAGVVACAMQVAVAEDLAVELDSGQITMEAATGNGASSGYAVEGYLVNQHTIEVSVDISLNRPLFMRNRGRGQNMVATHVYLGGGRYQSDGRRSFISLKPKLRTRVQFVAYCVDFEKDNPVSTDTFSLAPPPADLETVLKAITAYSKSSR